MPAGAGAAAEEWASPKDSEAHILKRGVNVLEKRSQCTGALTCEDFFLFSCQGSYITRVPVRATSAQKEEHGIANQTDLIQVKETYCTCKRDVFTSCDQSAEGGAWKDTYYSNKRARSGRVHIDR
jgi:hypothetical protein